jgi:hypothetical protein
MYCTNRGCPDFISTGIHGEYRDGISVCPYCGEALTDSLPDPVSEEGADDAAQDDQWSQRDTPFGDKKGRELEPVFETSDPTEVPIVRSFLDNNGIPHVVVGQERFDAFRGSLSPFRFNPRAGVVAFLVPVSLAETARDLLAAIEDPPEKDG